MYLQSLDQCCFFCFVFVKRFNKHCRCAGEATEQFNGKTTLGALQDYRSIIMSELILHKPKNNYEALCHLVMM